MTHHICCSLHNSEYYLVSEFAVHYLLRRQSDYLQRSTKCLGGYTSILRNLPCKLVPGGMIGPVEVALFDQIAVILCIGELLIKACCAKKCFAVRI